MYINKSKRIIERVEETPLLNHYIKMKNRLIVMKNRKTQISSTMENCNNNINNKRIDNLIKNLVIVIIN